MLGLVGRERLEKAEAETSMVLAQFAEAVATAKEFLANHHRTMALLRDWQRMYEERGAELTGVRAELKEVRASAIWLTGSSKYPEWKRADRRRLSVPTTRTFTNNRFVALGKPARSSGRTKRRLREKLPGAFLMQLQARRRIRAPRSSAANALAHRPPAAGNSKAP